MSISTGRNALIKEQPLRPEVESTRFYRPLIILTFIVFALWQLVEERLLHHEPIFYSLTYSAMIEAALALIIVLSALRLAARQQQALDQARKVRDEMAAALANDLRQPLVTVVSALRSLGDISELPFETQKTVKQAMRSIRPVVGMAVELLSVTDPLAEDTQLQELDCSDLLRGVLPTILTVATAREVEVRYQVPEALPAILGRPHSLFRTFMILLDGAVRLTPHRGQVSLTAQEVGPRGIEILISDGGPAFSREERQVLENGAIPTQTVEVGDRPLRPGLNYCATVIKAHRGSIRLETANERGNTIVIRIPPLHKLAA
jgi:K+-sensing histidine kinase KdpD